jgi:hypothetical protein
MYVRIVRAQAPPGQVEELAQRWQAFWGSQMPQIPGFRAAELARTARTRRGGHDQRATPVPWRGLGDRAVGMRFMMPESPPHHASRPVSHARLLTMPGPHL